ncbi:hypothetical protein AURDEDRAFT_177711 [Auricularia subglabra TFB-10046 SS5]|uniref:F-box domain-containing protein n=1 Tax=Auricularia subglabra (strain TFB-10046 / SS5) TaxID=717982 RepID=J0L9Y2_AURST|nr:hypothetical protein AURDEDRAFT_177711 [Auricularia subglabra TFB-10046 SS5]
MSLVLQPQLHPNNAQFFSMISIIREHLWHVVSLEVAFASSPSGPYHPPVVAFMSRLRQAAPVLERFALVFDRPGRRIYPPAHLFDRNAPRLRCFMVNAAIVLRNLPPAFGALTQLQCEFTPHLHDLLTVFPPLESVVLDSTELWHLPHGVLSHYPGRPSRLALRLPVLAKAASLLRYFRCHTLRHVRISHYFNIFEDIRASGFLGGKVMRRLSVSHNCSPLISQRRMEVYFSGDSMALHVENAPICVDWPAWLLIDIAQLTVDDEVDWVCCLRLPGAVDLAIILTGGQTVNSDRKMTLAPMADMPKLRTVTISAIGQRTLSSAEIMDVISLRVGVSARRLVTVCLVNMNVAVTNAGAEAKARLSNSAKIRMPLSSGHERRFSIEL